VAVMPRHYVALSGSPHTVGSLAAAFAITYLMVQLVVGRLADRYGFRRFIIAGYFICAAAGVCFYISADAFMLILGRLIQGVGEAPAWSLAPAVLAHQDPARPDRLIGTYSAVLHVGLALGPALGILCRFIWPEESVFAVFAGLCFCGGWILIGSLRADTPCGGAQHQPSYPRELPGEAAEDRTIMAVLLGVALYGAGYGAFLTVIPVYLQAAKGFGETGIGLFFSGFYVAIGLAALLTGLLSDRIGPRRSMTAGLAAAAIAIAFLPAAEGMILRGLLFTSMLALGIFGMSSLGYLNALAAPERKGTYAGFYFLAWGLGMFLGPLVIGAMDALAAPGTGLESYGVFTGLYGLLLGQTLTGEGTPVMD
jgi:MFS family permease